MTIQRIGLVVHDGRAAAREVAQTIRDWAAERCIPLRDLDVWNESGEVAVRKHARQEVLDCGFPDLIVTVGGDGTFLRGARIAAQDNAAVLGINVGTLGFLTEVEPAHAIEALEAYAAGDAQIEDRLTLTMRASRPLEVPHGMDALLRKGRGPLLPPPARRDEIDADDIEDVGWGVPLDITAINDVVFEKLVRDRQAHLGIYLDGRLFTTYSADAVIVATATGSTAYSFAAGGPVLSPRLDAMVFTPVAPHMVFNRSLVLAADELVAALVLPESGPIAVSVDGQVRGIIEPGDWIALYAGTARMRMVRMQRPDFFARLRSRFGLSDAPAAQSNGTIPLEYRPAAPVPDDIARLFRP